MIMLVMAQKKARLHLLRDRYKDWSEHRCRKGVPQRTLPKLTNSEVPRFHIVIGSIPSLVFWSSSVGT